MSNHYIVSIHIKKEDMTKKPVELVAAIEHDLGWVWDDIEEQSDEYILRYDFMISGCIEKTFQQMSEEIWELMNAYCPLRFHVRYLSEIPTEDFFYEQKEYDNYFMKGALCNQNL